MLHDHHLLIFILIHTRVTDFESSNGIENVDIQL
jgi:hypothetical protein